MLLNAAGMTVSGAGGHKIDRFPDFLDAIGHRHAQGDPAKQFEVDQVVPDKADRLPIQTGFGQDSFGGFHFAPRLLVEEVNFQLFDALLSGR